MAQIETLTHATVERMRVDGYASVMSTMLRGRAAFRLCPINPSTTEAEITETVARLTRFSAELAGGM